MTLLLLLIFLRGRTDIILAVVTCLFHSVRSKHCLLRLENDTLTNFTCPIMGGNEEYIYCCKDGTRSAKCCGSLDYFFDTGIAKGSSATGFIVGIVLGIVVILLILFVVTCVCCPYCRWYKQRRKEAAEDAEMAETFQTPRDSTVTATTTMIEQLALSQRIASITSIPIPYQAVPIPDGNFPPTGFLLIPPSGSQADILSLQRFTQQAEPKKRVYGPEPNPAAARALALQKMLGTETEQ